MLPPSPNATTYAGWQSAPAPISISGCQQERQLLQQKTEHEGHGEDDGCVEMLDLCWKYRRSIGPANPDRSRRRRRPWVCMLVLVAGRCQRRR